VSSTLHAHPTDDVIVHDTSTAEPDCVCGPEVRPIKQADGAVGWLLVHHSLDGREQAEGGRPAPGSGASGVTDG
jgi:hypothetical protein